MSEFVGNKGEWSEIYVFLRLLEAGKLYAADKSLNKIDSVFYDVLRIDNTKNICFAELFCKELETKVKQYQWKLTRLFEVVGEKDRRTLLKIKFAYSDLNLDKMVIGVQGSVRLSCKVKNVGKMEGDEVVQLYLRDEQSSVTTYVKVLRGFERIHLLPGEEKTVDFLLTPQELGIWNKDGRFVVEPGTFSVMIGGSSEDIRLKGQFEVRAY